MTTPGYPVLGTHAKYYGGLVHNLPLTEANHFLPDLDSVPKEILGRAKERPILRIDEESVTVGQMIDYLRRRLSFEDRPIRLKQLLRTLHSRQSLVCTFLALLEMVRLQAIELRQESLFGEVLVRRASGFDALVNQEAAIRDDWK